MTCQVEIPPGDPGLRPHRHSGPVFGYVLEGELLFELEGEPARLIAAGEPFWEPGGDIIHYQTANNRSDTWTRIIAVMIGIPGEQMLSSSTTTNSPNGPTSERHRPPDTTQPPQGRICPFEDP